ncbi:L,D-transpeptidase [Oscillatoria sp. FACHB-1406]|nr:L,D-transpeptidase [Oscillatoria sp. FACHB-1406]
MLASVALLFALAIGNISAPTFAQSSADILQTIAYLRTSNEHWIEVNLTTQRLIAWQGGKSVFAVIVATGKPSTPTATGVFSITSKQPQARMRGSGFDVPDVPFVLYYGNAAIHGAYWRVRFGQPISHGTVYLAPDRAQWLYNWAEVGTPVIVRQL